MWRNAESMMALRLLDCPPSRSSRLSLLAAANKVAYEERKLPDGKHLKIGTRALPRREYSYQSSYEYEYARRRQTRPCAESESESRLFGFMIR